MPLDDAALATLYASRTHTPAPAYQRVKDLLAEQIRSGSWAAGDLLPSENRLVTALGLSRMTVNRALRELSADGLVTRRMGVGTFVAERTPSSALFEIHNIADDVADRGHSYRAEVVALRSEVATGATADHFAMRDGDPVFLSRIVHFEDDIAIQLEDRMVDPRCAPDYLAQDFTVGTPNEYLTSVAPADRGEHVVEAVGPTDDEARLLGIDASIPCLLLRRRTWAAGRLVSVARLLHPGSRYRLSGTFDAGLG